MSSIGAGYDWESSGIAVSSACEGLGGVRAASRSGTEDGGRALRNDRISSKDVREGVNSVDDSFLKGVVSTFAIGGSRLGETGVILKSHLNLTRRPCALMGQKCAVLGQNQPSKLLFAYSAGDSPN